MPAENNDPLDAWIAAVAPRALAYARSLVREPADAEDLVHDCFGRLLAHSRDYDLVRDGDKLLFKSITHACIDWTRRQRPQSGLETAEREDRSSERPDRQALRNEMQQAVHQALEALDVTDRAIVELRSLGHSLVEVAEMLSLSHANARVKLHRARQTLAERLQPYLDGES